MSAMVAMKSSLVRIRRLLSVCCVALAVGWAAAGVAAPADDLINAKYLAAAYHGDMASVRALLAKGADVNAKTNSGGTALMLASVNGHLDVVQALLAKGAEVNAEESHGGTALMMASEQGNREVVQALLAKGAEVDAKRNYDGGTALIGAAQNGHSEVVQALLAKGADVNAKTTDDGWTALILASKHGYRDVVQALLDKGAEVDDRTNVGATALMMASDNGNPEVVRALLDKGADVNAKTNLGTTALIRASLSGHRDIVQSLLAKGAEVNAQTSNGTTALMVARDADIKALLVQAGADPHQGSTTNQTPTASTTNVSGAPNKETYRDLKPEDGIQFAAYVDEMSFSFGGKPSGKGLKFGLIDPSGKFIQLELVDRNFDNGRIKTKMFGDIIATSNGTASMRYAATGDQIKKIREFLSGRVAKSATTPE
jgi:ankyrin repeat protein